MLRKNPFSLQEQDYVDKFINLASGAHINAEKVSFLKAAFHMEITFTRSSKNNAFFYC